MNENPDLSILSDNVDKSQVPPIEQKRMVAFINDFIISTVSFLNQFMTQCDTKFIEFEQKMQKIEASLLIVEAKIASIPDVDLKPPTNAKTDDKTEMPKEIEPQTSTETETETVHETSSTSQAVTETNTTEIESGQDEHDKSIGVKASDDTRYRKYFKMLQFGVPPPAVKMKMANEGFDSNVLDDPNRILEDGVAFVASEE